MILEEYSWFHGGAAVFHKGTKVALGSHVEEEAAVAVRGIAYGIVAPILVAVGILGNVMVIALLRLPQFKGVVFSYFTVLAVSDLFSLGFSISPLHHVLAGGTLHHATAVWYSYFELLFVGASMSFSVLIVVSITVYRFFSVCRPRSFQRVNTLKFARGSMLLALCLAVIAWLPMSFVSGPKEADNCVGSSFKPPDNRTWWVSCWLNDRTQKGYFIAYVWIRQVIITFLPIAAVVTLNLFTLRGFLQHRRMRRRMLNSTQASVSKTREEKQLMGLLIAVIISFVITIVPSGIANAINTSTRTSELEFVVFSAVANNLEILNHTLNFYLYILCSKQVRDTLREWYKKKRFNMRVKGLSREVKAEEEGKKGNQRESESSNDNKRIYVISCTSLPPSSVDQENVSVLRKEIQNTIRQCVVSECEENRQNKRLDSARTEGNRQNTDKECLESAWGEENRQNEAKHNSGQILLPHLITNTATCFDNPNFKF